MSRGVSLTARQALYARETGEAFLVLLTIDHPDLAVAIRVGSDAVDTVSRGETFTAFPFGLALPNDSGDRPSRARLTIDNVDRQIVQALRQISGPPSVLIEIVRAAAPDTVEASFPNFELSSAVYDALVVQGDLTLQALVREPYPAGRITPATFPGVY